MQPLQTHGQYTSRWVPPKPDRFTVYDAGDEAWARPLGLGSVEQCLVNLYDVRDERNDLVGYTGHNPEAYHSRKQFSMWIGSLQDLEQSEMHVAQMRHDAFKPDSICRIEIRLVQLEYNGEHFISWHVPLQYGAELMAGGFLCCIGPDHRDRYVRELRRRWEERDYRHQMRFGNSQKVPTDIRSRSYMG
jgi:hypothetical protein